MFVNKVLVKVAIEENFAFQMVGQLFVVGLQEKDDLLLVFGLVAVLEDFFNEKVKNSGRGVKVLNFQDFLLRQGNQIVKGVLVTFEPYCFSQLLDICFVVDCAYLLDV